MNWLGSRVKVSYKIIEKVLWNHLTFQLVLPLNQMFLDFLWFINVLFVYQTKNKLDFQSIRFDFFRTTKTYFRFFDHVLR